MWNKLMQTQPVEPGEIFMDFWSRWVGHRSQNWLSFYSRPGLDRVGDGWLWRTAVIGVVKLALEAGKATPAPPVGPALGSKGVNIMAFCKEYNAKTADKPGYVIPVEITVFDVCTTKPACLKHHLQLSFVFQWIYIIVSNVKSAQFAQEDDRTCYMPPK